MHESYHMTFLLMVCIYAIIIVDSKRNYFCDIDRGELSYYDKNIGKNVMFNYSRINQTFIKVSASFDVATNEVGSDAALTGVIRRRVNNQWQRIPLSIDVNLCEMFKKNQYFVGLVELTKHGNLSPCNVVPKHYHLDDYVPDLDFPPMVPPGKYWATGIIRLRERKLFVMEWYATLRRA